MNNNLQPPLGVLISNARSQILGVVNQIQLPPALIESVLTSLIADLRNQEMIEMTGYISQLSGIEKEEGGEDG